MSKDGQYVPKNVRLTPEQLQLLKEGSEALGVSVNQMLRGMVDYCLCHTTIQANGKTLTFKKR